MLLLANTLLKSVKWPFTSPSFYMSVKLYKAPNSVIVDFDVLHRDTRDINLHTNSWSLSNPAGYTVN